MSVTKIRFENERLSIIVFKSYRVRSNLCFINVF